MPIESTFNVRSGTSKEEQLLLVIPSPIVMINETEGNEEERYDRQYILKSGLATTLTSITSWVT